MSAFNPEQFENLVIEQENATSMVPIPEGDYQAYVEAYEFGTYNPPDGKVRPILNVDWVIPDEELADSLNIPEVKLRQAVFLDVTYDANDQPEGLDFGVNKNVQLGKLRAALGLNSAEAFQFSQIVSKPATIQVVQRPDKDDASVIYSRVAKVHSPQSSI